MAFQFYFLKFLVFFPLRFPLHVGQDEPLKSLEETKSKERGIRVSPKIWRFRLRFRWRPAMGPKVIILGVVLPYLPVGKKFVRFCLV